MKIQLKSEARDAFIQRILDFFYNERGEEIGIIAAGTILEFIMDEIGGDIYNKGLDAGRAMMKARMDDLFYDMDELYK
jgi:uncharacterized protein (DUF2164 family)